MAAVVAAVLATACDGIGDIVTPGQENRELRIFRRPFDGHFLNSWPFDHDLPLGAFTPSLDVTGSDDVLTWRGTTAVMVWGNGRHHDGHDWAMPEGTPLLAVADGTVVFAGRNRPVQCGARGELAALVVTLSHTTDSGVVYESFYAHLSQIDVETGTRVHAGQRIGLSGSTGCAFGPHLHFGVYRYTADGMRVVVDPFGWEGQEPDPWELATGVPSLWLWKIGEAPQGNYAFRATLQR